MARKSDNDDAVWNDDHPYALGGYCRMAVEYIEHRVCDDDDDLAGALYPKEYRADQKHAEGQISSLGRGNV